jgi:lycopene cyclase domain-containing protein
MSGGFLSHFSYLFMEVYIIGLVALVLWIFHFRYLWSRMGRILAGVVIVTLYALPLDMLGVANQWGGFNPDYVLGIAFFGGILYLEEIIFWLGTSFVTLCAVMIFAELERRNVPWWILPAGIIVPIDWLSRLFEPQSPHKP